MNWLFGNMNKRLALAAWFLLGLVGAGKPAAAGVIVSGDMVESRDDGPIINPNGLKPYAVHEWGVFSVYPGVRYANVDMAGEWAGCPKELYRAFPGERISLPYHGPVLKPIIYFHWKSDDAPPAKPFAVQVLFPDGRPLIWYPATEQPVYTGMQGKREEVTDRLAWELYLRKAPPSRFLGGGQVSSTPDVAEDHWYSQARKPRAEKVFAYGGCGNVGQETTTEQFVYYDGVTKPLHYLRAKRDEEGRIVLENTAPFAIYDLYAVERTDKELRLAHVHAIPVDTREIKLDWQWLKGGKQNITLDWEKCTSQALADDLHHAGLNADEAKALVDIWNPGFFEQDGLTLIYRLPQKEYSRVTELTLDPAPATLVRIGLVCHHHAEPELTEHVKALIAQLAGPQKEAATAQLIKLGGAALDGLYNFRQEKGDPAIKEAVKDMIGKIDITAASDWEMPTKK